VRWPARWRGAGGVFRRRARCPHGLSSAVGMGGAADAGAGGLLWRASGAWPCGGWSSQGAAQTAQPCKRRAVANPATGGRRDCAGVGRSRGDRGRVADRSGAGAVDPGALQVPQVQAGSGGRGREADTERRSLEGETPHACERPEHRSPQRSLRYVRGKRTTSDQGADQGHSVFVEILHDRLPEAIKGCVRGGALLARHPPREPTTLINGEA
jgi:hypothetical protein